MLTIVLVALALRLAVITVGHTYRITPRRDHFQYGWEMGRLARSLARGQGFSSPTDLPSGPSAWAPPLYPYVLAGVFRLFGIYSPLSAWIILAFNSVFAALTCVPLYRIGQKLFSSSVARGAAWTWALFPYAIYWPVRVVWETSLTTCLLAFSLWLALVLADAPFRRRVWVGFGLLWGGIMLTNTAVLSLFPCLLLWILFRSRERRRIALNLGLCLLSAALTISPWLVRNYLVFGKFVFIRDNLPLEMHEANNDESEGLWTRSEHPGNDPASMRRFAELGEKRYMEEKRQQVQQFVRQHPGRFAVFTLKRVWYFWAAPPQATIVAGYDLMIARHTEFLLAAALAFAGLGLALARHLPGGGLLACFLVVYPLPYYLVNPFVRYKHPIEPVMVLLIVYLFSEARTVQVRIPLLAPGGAIPKSPPPPGAAALGYSRQLRGSRPPGKTSADCLRPRQALP